MFARRIIQSIIACAAAVFVTGCAMNSYTTEPFRFPILNGNIDQGRTSFVALGCHRCHTVSGVELPAWPGESPLTLELGGRILFVKTYGELVTSIINPNHVISEKYLNRLPRTEQADVKSPMPFYGEMTVEQLIDIVTFLNSRYELLEPDYYPGEDRPWRSGPDNYMN